ncbi:MAG: SAM-dependent chlorinase/fluorinase [Flavobacteriaceae bacterium]|nr:SAM-dependent chlorinase/fluorinase [Flavobacteriaceae bacterium]
MPVITLTTDFGNADHSVASVKGALLKEMPDARLVDITHEIQPFDIAETAMVIKNVYPNFPENTVHIIGVDAIPDNNARLLAAKIDGHYFLAADNGVLSLILAELKPEIMVEITIGRYNPQSNFPTRDIFVPVASHLLRGGKLEIIGNTTNTYKELNYTKPIMQNEKLLVGIVISIDRFGNIITNIKKQTFEEHRRGRNFTVNVRNHQFKKILNRYADIILEFPPGFNVHGEKMAIFNASDFLEIALYKSDPKTFGGANTLLGINKGDNISIEFN